MYKSLSLLTVIILLVGCATTRNQFTGNTHTDAIMDANVLVIVSQDQVLGQVNSLQIDQGSIDIATKHTGAGPGATIFAVGLINVISQSFSLNRMQNLVKPINDRTGDLDFRKDLVSKLQEKCIFTTPERIVVTDKTPEYDADLLKLITGFDNDAPTIVISAGYGFDSNYRVLIVDTSISLWLDKQDTPAYTTRTSYYSPPITPFIKTYTPSFGDALLLRVNDKITEKVHAPNVSLWSNNRASIYRKYYAEGIEETAKMIVNALSNKIDSQSAAKRKLTTFIDYHIPLFGENITPNNNSDQGRVLEKENDRMLLVADNGSLHSVYNGSLVNPSEKAKTYSRYR
jgi:hypothetical protein